ncbi:hypothetical protein APTSU1_000302400 [Apodemus speciosus]|uniref:Uncharacterized protein n=1 Tax=Apodemus speciosus TaxID=105296 RepID=A0ABQ0EL35_APOSI
MLTLPGAAQQQAQEDVESPPKAPGLPHPRGKAPGRPAAVRPVTVKAILELKSM